ncbi:MAG: hypothetical protein ACLRT5_18045 [Lachnospiraceae bacterium]
MKKPKVIVGISIIGVILITGILFMGNRAADVETKPDDRTVKNSENSEDEISDNREIRDSEETAEPDFLSAYDLDYREFLERREVENTFELEPAAYIEEIMGDWEYLLKEEIVSYVMDKGLEAYRAPPLAYGGYLADQDTHLFYLTLDDPKQTVLLARYHAYHVNVEAVNRTEEEILSEKEAQGDPGLIDEEEQ